MPVISIALLLIFVLEITATATTTKTRYDGYTLLEVIPETTEHLLVLQEWSSSKRYLDFWDDASFIGRPVSLFVSSQWVDDVRRQLSDENIHYTILPVDVQSEIDNLWTQLESRPANYAVNLSSWNPLSEILPWMDQVAANCSRQQGVICQTYTGYYSYEGRPIKVLRMSKSETNRKAYYIDATIHAREWMTIATLMNVISHMINDYPSDPDVQRLVDGYDWYFLPVLNPDGYEYSWTTDRMWRKNRNPNAGSDCVGTDNNRNFNYKWCTSGASRDPCSNTFCGSGPSSEAENKAVAAESARVASSLGAYISLHAPACTWMHPWGTLTNSSGVHPDDCEIAEDEAEMMEVTLAAVEAVQATHEDAYWRRGNSCKAMYPTSGTTADYLKGVDGIKYAFTVELRGNSTFTPPDTDIQPSYEEFWNGLVAMVDKIEEKNGP